MEDKKILEVWAEIRTLVESVDKDVTKNAEGNLSAGLRVRNDLLAVRKLAQEVRKLSLEADKGLRGTKRPKAAAAAE